MNWEIEVGDCLEVMRGMEAGSVDAIVTDPPYGLEFMGVAWDTMRDDGKPRTRNEWEDFGSREHARHPSEVQRIRRSKGMAFYKFSEAWAIEALRVAKPGAHLLAFGGTRTHHRLMCAIEDAGWEMRDTLGWLYGSGFPKSKNLDGGWSGWGTALKPAWEPIVLARKPLVGTVAANVEAHGCGALNIDACRIGDEQTTTTIKDLSQAHGNQFGKAGIAYPKTGEKLNPPGRWPANIIHDGSDEALAVFPEVSAGVAVRHRSGGKTCHSDLPKPPMDDMGYGDSGSAARFFYCAKASRSEREGWLRHYSDLDANGHPTVKPIALMQYLCRLVTPPGGLVLDPFTGSGSTGIAATREGFRFVGIELSPEYAKIARNRIFSDAPLLHGPGHRGV